MTSTNAKRTEVKGTRLDRIQSLLEQIDSQFAAEPPEATLADFIRLMQLEHQLDDGTQPGEIVVRWEDPER